MNALRPVHRALIDAFDQSALPDGTLLFAATSRVARDPLLAKAALAAVLKVEADAEARAALRGRPAGMHPEEIKAALRIAGTTPAMLAEQLGITDSTVSTAIHGRSESARVKARIAQIIGKPVASIWPKSNKPRLQRPNGSVPARKRARA